MEVKIRHFTQKFSILDPSIKKRYKGLRGGRSSGKSWGVVATLVGFACQYKVFIVAGREIQKSIKESAQKLFLDTIARYGLTDQFICTNTDIVNINTGARIIFMGVKSNPEAIKGLEGADIVWLEEADRVSQESWDLIIPTVRKKGSQIWATWNPSMPTDPVEQIFDKNNPDAVVETINYLENPHCSPEIIAEAQKMLANDPQKYQWIYLGQFRPTGSDTLIPLQLVINAIGRPPTHTEGEEIVAGLDLGFYQDRSVLAIRQGNNIMHIQVWENPDTVELIPEVLGLMTRFKVARIGVDALGPGAPIIQLLRANIGDRVIPVAYSGAPVKDPKQYKNLRAEAWGLTKELLEDGSLPTGMDNDIIADLCSARYFYDEKGKIQIESKKAMVSRGIRSSDIADSIGISLTVYGKAKIIKKPRTFSSSRQPQDWMGI